MTNQQTQPPNNAPVQIAAFDSSYVLVAIFRSISEAATMTGALRQSLIKAASGEIISVNKRYWRTVPADIQLEPDDIGELTLLEFDSEVGEDRKIYPTRKMTKGTAILESEYVDQYKKTEN